MNDKPFSDDPELLIAAGVFDNHIDAIDAIVKTHVTEAVVASRLAETIRDAESQQPSGPMAASIRGPQPGPFPAEISSSRLSPSMLVKIEDHFLEMPPLHGRWALLRTVLSGHRPGSDHETRLAVDLDDRTRKVVIKRVAPPTADQDPDRLRQVADRFKMEMRRQSSISSPYVAPVIDSGFAPGFGFFIVTERYAGTMADRLKPGASASLTLAWGLSVIEDVLCGLIDCFEQTGIVHLDIKPSNIALDNGRRRAADRFRAREASLGRGHQLQLRQPRIHRLLRPARADASAPRPGLVHPCLRHPCRRRDPLRDYRRDAAAVRECPQRRAGQPRRSSQPGRAPVLDQVDEHRPCHPARPGGSMATRLRKRADHELARPQPAHPG